jgi:hypothetical protein
MWVVKKPLLWGGNSYLPQNLKAALQPFLFTKT